MVVGKLSTQKYPRSWNALVAEDIPDPLSPVMMTMSGVLEGAAGGFVFRLGGIDQLLVICHLGGCPKTKKLRPSVRMPKKISLDCQGSQYRNAVASGLFGKPQLD
jgi:hypothetical protein